MANFSIRYLPIESANVVAKGVEVRPLVGILGPALFNHTGQSLVRGRRIQSRPKGRLHRHSPYDLCQSIKRHTEWEMEKEVKGKKRRKENNPEDTPLHFTLRSSKTQSH